MPGEWGLSCPLQCNGSWGGHTSLGDQGLAVSEGPQVLKTSVCISTTLCLLFCLFIFPFLLTRGAEGVHRNEMNTHILHILDNVATYPIVVVKGASSFLPWVFVHVFKKWCAKKLVAVPRVLQSSVTRTHSLELNRALQTTRPFAND